MDDPRPIPFLLVAVHFDAYYIGAVLGHTATWAMNLKASGI